MHAVHKNISGIFVLFVLMVAVWMPLETRAHHGWGWASEEEFEITGEITVVRLGNPHGQVTMTVEGQPWVVEVGQPWRNERAGLTPERLRSGEVMTVHGHRSSRPEERLVKAERVIIAGQEYNLYPDRRS